MTYPIIGSKYEGPPLDRPCLRKMPEGWVLHDDAPKPQPVFRIVIAIFLAFLFTATIIRQLL